MPSPSAMIRGLVSRMLPPPDVDGPDHDRVLRLGRYGDAKVESAWPTDHLLADEGAMVVAATAPAATALQLGISASFSAVAAAFVLANTDPPGGRRLYPRALRLAQSVAPTSGVDLRYAIVLDGGAGVNRIPTILSSPAGAQQGPGTPATQTAYRAPAVSTNMDVTPAVAGAAFFPLSTAGGTPPTVPAASPNARTIIGNGYLKNSIPVVKDQYQLQFGGADLGGTFQGAAALAKIVEHAPAVVVGPGQFMLIHLWSASNITAGNAWDDVALSWVER